MTQHQLRFLRLKNEIVHELGQFAALGEELRQIEDAEIGVASARKRALASILHDFYTGCERIFTRIAEEFEGGLPNGPAWHRLLLQDMALDQPGIRPPVISTATAKILEDYLAFRHRFRNIYGHELNYDRIKPLLRGLPAVMQRVRADLDCFLSRQEEVLDDAGRS